MKPMKECFEEIKKGVLNRDTKVIEISKGGKQHIERSEEKYKRQNVYYQRERKRRAKGTVKGELVKGERKVPPSR